MPNTDTQSPEAADQLRPPIPAPAVSMHEHVEVWEDDICTCAAEPRWQALEDELQAARPPSAGPTPDPNHKPDEVH